MSPTRSPCQPVPSAPWPRSARGSAIELRMAPVAIARQPHHLPGLAVDRQRDGAGETALGVEADRARLQAAPASRLRPNSSLAGCLGIVGIGERRQRLRIDRALVLRGRDRCRNRCDRHARQNRLPQRKPRTRPPSSCRYHGSYPWPVTWPVPRNVTPQYAKLKRILAPPEHLQIRALGWNAFECTGNLTPA